MQGKTPQQIILQALNPLSASIQPRFVDRYAIKIGDDDLKAAKKKFKKWIVQDNDSVEKGLQKVNKLLDQLSRHFETSGKQLVKTQQSFSKVEESEAEREKANKQKLMFENLFNGFKKKYDEQIKNAEKIEKQEEQKRKATIDELQERIKTIQGQYEEAGKIKIQKFRENQTLKHQLSKFQPHLVASESLADAQLKKKSIEIEIQMTTLKQKIQMMSSFKSMREETEQKLKKAKELDQKLGVRLGKLSEKEEEHKLSLAKAHLVFEEYKKAFNNLKVTLPQKEKQAFQAKEKVKKNQKSLEEIKKKNEALDKDYQTHIDQLQMLKKLQQQIQAQLDA